MIMQLNETIREHVLLALPELFEGSFSPADFQVSQTKPEFEGDYTVVLFSLVKLLKKSPDSGDIAGLSTTGTVADNCIIQVNRDRFPASHQINVTISI